jgi:hypothetical integral membrane protein (TIGR02206 family)
MGQFLAWNYTGEPFRLFSLSHLIVLSVLVLVNLSIIYLRPNASPQARRAFRYGLAALLILNEMAWHLWIWTTGNWTVQTMLPLHLCSLFVWISAIMLITKSYTLYEFAYFLGIGGATQALLTPSLGIYGFPHFRFFQIFIAHGSIVTAAIYMTVIEQYRPYWTSLLHAVVGANLYMLLVGLVNALIGSNYMFIAHKPDTPSLLDVLGPWPWYILSAEAVGLAVGLLLYLPFALRDWKAQPVV